MHNPVLGVSLQQSVDGDINVIFVDEDGELVFWFDDEDAMQQTAGIARWGLALLADAEVLGFRGAVEFHSSLILRAHRPAQEVGLAITALPAPSSVRPRLPIASAATGDTSPDSGYPRSHSTTSRMATTELGTEPASSNGPPPRLTLPYDQREPTIILVSRRAGTPAALHQRRRGGDLIGSPPIGGGRCALVCGPVASSGSG